MTEEDVVAYYDDPAYTRCVCDLLLRAYPTWLARRENRIWLTRHRTWRRGRQPIADRTAGLLHQAIWETNVRGVLA
ncbi:hypothetical protein ACGFNP_14885 [Nonomuraea sp. NPDC049269]|uniref:hypothetical protein n=1 Tax=Nonomuraea sp. NPDC049269 TaxID=3364349 RepID=UPI00371625E3